MPSYLTAGCEGQNVLRAPDRQDVGQPGREVAGLERFQQNGGVPPTTQQTQPMTTSAPPAETTYRKPTEPTPATSTPATPPPTPGANSPYDVKKNDNSTYLEAPKLFSPQDRTAQRSIAPVHNALYNQPASYRQVSTAPIVVTAEQARKDASGWSSASK